MAYPRSPRSDWIRFQSRAAMRASIDVEGPAATRGDRLGCTMGRSCGRHRRKQGFPTPFANCRSADGGSPFAGGRLDLAGPGEQIDAAAQRLADGAGGQGHRRHHFAIVRPARRRRYDHRRRQQQLQRFGAARRVPQGAGYSIYRRRHQRRHLGTERRLRPDGRRRRRRGAATHAHLPDARASARQRLGPRRASRHRPLRQDDPQRH